MGLATASGLLASKQRPASGSLAQVCWKPVQGSLGLAGPQSPAPGGVAGKATRWGAVDLLGALAPALGPPLRNLERTPGPFWRPIVLGLQKEACVNVRRFLKVIVLGVDGVCL